MLTTKGTLTKRLAHDDTQTSQNEQNKKRTLDSVEDGDQKREDRGQKRQRRSEEPSATQFARLTAIEHPHSTVNTSRMPHESTPPVIPNSPRTDPASAPTHHLGHIFVANVAPMSGPACRPSKSAIPTKRRVPTLSARVSQGKRKR